MLRAHGIAAVKMLVWGRYIVGGGPSSFFLAMLSRLAPIAPD